MIIVMMGVSGAGKSTVGRRLADRMQCEFHEGDDYHTEESRRRMSAGYPAEAMREFDQGGCIRVDSLDRRLAMIEDVGTPRSSRQVMGCDVAAWTGESGTTEDALIETDSWCCYFSSSMPETGARGLLCSYSRSSWKGRDGRSGPSMWRSPT